jgi:hypothetical protein
MKGVKKKSSEACLIYFSRTAIPFPFIFHVCCSIDITAPAALDFNSAFSGPGYVIAILI